MDELNKAVIKAFATTFVYYYKAHQFHWNLKDKDFPQFHEFFGDIYDEVYTSIDPFAEKIRTLQIDAPRSLIEILNAAVITEAGGTTKDEMVAQLYNDGEVLVNALKEAYNLCELYSKHGISNFLAERMDAHEKHCWMLRSSM